MKDADQLRNLYDRFSKEMDNVELLSSSELMKMIGERSAGISDGKPEAVEQKTSRVIGMRWGRVAAAVALLLAGGGAFILFNHDSQTPLVAETNSKDIQNVVEKQLSNNDEQHDEIIIHQHIAQQAVPPSEAGQPAVSYPKSSQNIEKPTAGVSTAIEELTAVRQMPAPAENVPVKSQMDTKAELETFNAGRETETLAMKPGATKDTADSDSLVNTEFQPSDHVFYSEGRAYNINAKAVIIHPSDSTNTDLDNPKAMKPKKAREKKHDRRRSFFWENDNKNSKDVNTFEPRRNKSQVVFPAKY